MLTTDGLFDTAGRLFIPERGETLIAADGFQLFATIRCDSRVSKHHTPALAVAAPLLLPFPSEQALSTS